MERNKRHKNDIGLGRYEDSEAEKNRDRDRKREDGIIWPMETER